MQLTNWQMPVNVRFPELFDEFRSELEHLASRFGLAESATTGNAFVPKMNLAEADDRYELWFELPGVSNDAVDIAYHQGELVISGNREWPGSDLTWRHVESPTGPFRRAVRFDAEVLGDKIEASLENGLLHLIVPKDQKAQTRHIPIKS